MTLTYSGEVAPGLHRIVAPLGDRVVATYVLAGDDTAVLVDTGIASTPAESILPYLAQAGIDKDDLRWVLISHPDIDHTGGNAALRSAAPHAQFGCHELDRAMVEDLEVMIRRRYCEFEESDRVREPDEALAWARANSGDIAMDFTVQGGERIRLSHDWWIEVLHTPGHSWGHLTVRDPRSGAVVISDAVLGRAIPSVEGGAAFAPTYRYVDSYLATIHLLEALRPPLVLTSHFPVIEGGEALTFLAESRLFVEHVEHAVRTALRDRAQTLHELIDSLSSVLGDWEPDAAYHLVYALGGHLERLVARGEVVGAPDPAGTVWRWTGGAS